MQNRLVICSLILLFIFVPVTKGQKMLNSPYSRFNLGSLNPSGSFRSLSMGGAGIAGRDNNTVFYNNPASYSSFDTTSFIFDFGLDFSKNTLITGNSSFPSQDMNFHHLLLGIPVGKHWGVATGLAPVSNGYYYLSQSVKSGVAGYDSVVGPYASIHKGGGSITNFFLGTGGNITKNLSAGINMIIVFGELDRLNQYEFEDYSSVFNQRGSQKLRVNGINFDYGLQYSAKIKKDYFITAGLTFSTAKKLSSSFEELKERFTVYSTSLYSPDTLSYSYSHSKDSTRLPATIRFGLAFGKKDKFVAEIDYVAAYWADARIQGSTGTLANTKSLMLGIAYTPDMFSNDSYLKRVEYRAGAHLSDNYLILKGVQVKDYGFSCGIGIRLSRLNPYSKANFYFDYTRRNGDLAKGLQNENIFSFGASLNLYDWWFQKRKYE
jgi:hypothetical protein